MLNEESRTMVEKRIEERIKGDMAEIHEKSGYNVIWVSVAPSRVQRPGHRYRQSRRGKGGDDTAGQAPQFRKHQSAFRDFHAGRTGFCSDRRSQRRQKRSHVGHLRMRADCTRQPMARYFPCRWTMPSVWRNDLQPAILFLGVGIAAFRRLFRILQQKPGELRMSSPGF